MVQRRTLGPFNAFREGFKRVDALYRALPSEAAPDELDARVQRAVRPRVLRFRPRVMERKRVWPLLAACLVKTPLP